MRAKLSNATSTKWNRGFVYYDPGELFLRLPDSDSEEGKAANSWRCSE